ncbi:MAG: VWA domain-containing protein [Clostridia bacterium]|nr:VWA domain-containing protein [Clostridia bacterium]
MKQRLIALALCLVMALGLAAPSFAVQADAPGGLDGAEPDLWDILAPDAPGGLTGGEETLPTPDEPAQLDTPVQELPEKDPDLTQAGENAPAERCLYCGAAGDVHADFCPLYVPAEPAEGPGSAEDAPVPPAPARPAEPTVALETVLEQSPAQAVRTLSAEQPGVLTDNQRFLAFSTFQRPRFAESKGTDGETPERVDNPGVYTDKKVEATGKGTYTVSIESYVTGRTITTETAAPVDIILVLDMSGQMKKADLIAMKTAANEFIEMASSEKGERRIALVTYQNNSGTVISGDRNADEGALVSVTKADGKAELQAAVNGLTSPDGDAYCQYGLARAAQIFQSYKKSAPRYVILLSAGVFGEDGKKLRGENSENAAQVAINVSTVLKTSPQGAKPNVKWGQNFYDGQAMDNTDTQDNLKKDQGLTISFDAGDYASGSIIPGGGCGAEVYCVGLNMPIQKKGGKVFDKLEYSDSSLHGYTREDSDNMAGYGNTAARINEAMYRICSDRPDSTHVTRETINNNNPWEIAAFPESAGTATYYVCNRYVHDSEKKLPQYYLLGAIEEDIHWAGTYPDWATRNMPGGHFLTGDTETIAEKFKTIFENIQFSNPAPSVTLDKNTVLIDVVMPYFEVPQGTSAITAKVVNVVTGQEVADLSKQLIVEYGTSKTDGTSSVSVKGFDYTENFVSADGKSGKKLVLTFTIQPIQGFMGGNGVPTNNVTQSGVFAKEGELVENLPNPGTQDVPLADIDLTVPDKSMYLSQALTETELLEGAVVTLTGDNKPLPLTEEAQKDDWRFDFVTLTVAANKSYTGEFTDCSEVPVTATLAAKDGKTTATATANPTVHVFRPTVHVSANDVWADYGQSIDLKTWCVAENFTADWACKDENAQRPSGDAPVISDLAYTFDLVGNGMYTTTEDDVEGKITALTYKVGGYTDNNLAWAVTYPEKSNAGEHFTIHINRFDLKVSKSWTGADCYKQSAIFNLSTENGQAMATQFTLSPETGKSSTTVHGLVCGKTYALSEDMDWSWRYRSASTGSVTPGTHDAISKTAPTIDPARVSFTNTLENSFWFDAASFVSNLFKGKGA